MPMAFAAQFLIDPILFRSRTVIKEWSILAIRNLCENNAENQQIIRQLSKVGDAENSDILKELNIDMGSLRIGSN